MDHQESASAVSNTSLARQNAQVGSGLINSSARLSAGGQPVGGTSLLNQPSANLSAVSRNSGADGLDPLDMWAQKEAALEEADF